MAVLQSTKTIAETRILEIFELLVQTQFVGNGKDDDDDDDGNDKFN